ncbi:hypothetical protein [Streptomyces sp. NPDC007205]|uniref:hypothetical protein n=1 Tax=Streptomyces sp. NPDC007205 TaxID=3154316 RepID=UPI0033C755DF
MAAPKSDKQPEERADREHAQGDADARRQGAGVRLDEDEPEEGSDEPIYLASGHGSDPPGAAVGWWIE